jgi:hypothetical protein
MSGCKSFAHRNFIHYPGFCARFRELRHRVMMWPHCGCAKQRSCEGDFVLALEKIAPSATTSIANVTPSSCPRCGAHAHLIRREYHAEIEGERRTFECSDCKTETEMTVKD